MLEMWRIPSKNALIFNSYCTHISYKKTIYKCKNLSHDIMNKRDNDSDNKMMIERKQKLAIQWLMPLKNE